jgi:hypothetical protein
VTEKFGAGQADKRAAEQRTAEVAANQKVAQERHAEIAKQNDPKQSGDPEWVKRGEGADATSAAERVAASEDPTAPLSPEVVDPFPAYEAKSVDELRSLAQSRKVEINRDAEKAHLVHLLRQKDGSPVYDVMPLEDLRSKAEEMDVQPDPEWEVSHWITELRAADTHTR